MCLVCEARLDATKQSAFSEKLLGILNNGMTTLLVSLGHRAGLFDILADGHPRTSAELAIAARMSERYIREWLAGMVVAGFVERDPLAGTHRLPLEHAESLSRKSATGNMALFAQYVSSLAGVEDELLDKFRNGGGVPYSAYPRFHDVMEEDSGQSIVPVIVEQVVPLMPGLHERLQSGIAVLDIGCGRGRAITRLAQTYPNSRFTGYDLNEEVVALANERATALGLTNISFIAKDLTHWNEPAAFDWIMALDAIHDQARPDNVLASIRRALRPGGVFMMQDIDGSSEPVNNINHPIGPMLYGVSLFHCMTVSLAQGGMGLGSMWGTELATRMLKEAGFEEVEIHRFEHDIQNAYYVMHT